MKTRTIQEIEKAFFEMGLIEGTWGQRNVPEHNFGNDTSTAPQIFIHIEATTTPLEDKTSADLA